MSDPIRSLKLTHQILSISDIDFENECLYGYTELTLAPIRPNLDITQIHLNCKQCKLYCIVFNGTIEVQDYEYADPLLVKPCGDDSKRDLQSMLYQDEYGRLTVDADEGNGELCISVPEPVQALIKQGQAVKLAIEFFVDKPSGGIRFILNRGYEEKHVKTNSYLYTVENQSSCWFPCIQSYNECCTWKLEITCDEELEVAASGTLIETEILNETLLSDTLNRTNMETSGLGMCMGQQQQGRRKRFHYFLSQPTCAPNVGVCVGRFETVCDVNMAEISCYGEPELIGLVKNSTSFLSEVFEFYEDLLSVTFPQSAYKLVFCYDVESECMHYSGLSILNVNLLTSSQIIDQTMVTRRVVAYAVARQFFGCFITMFDWHSWWLVTGIAQFVTFLFVKKMMGNNEYKYIVYQEMREVCAYEREQGYILLDLNFSELTGKDNTNKCHILLKNPLIAPANYMRIAEKKAHLVVKLIDDFLGREVMQQLLAKILAQAGDIPKKFTPENRSCWSAINLSTESFTQLLASFCSKDITFLLEHWVNRSGCARFNSSFTFNRKKNTVEIELKQDMTNQKGFRKYVGPITIIIQELDGSFTHNLQVEDNSTSCKFDISCHSKGKKSKKKKIPLITGEEVDIDTSQMDGDSPILWIRIDPDMKILRDVKFEQPDHQWQHQLKYERDVTAQLDAIEMLTKFPTTQTRATLISAIENTEGFYRIRVQACYALAEVANKMVHSWNGPQPLISTFKKFYTVQSSQNLVVTNNFSDLQQYFLQKAIPVAIGSLRSTHNLCPPDMVRFILDLIRLNENSRNQFSDAYYKAALIDGLANTITASIAQLQNIETSSNLSTEMQLVCEEICLRLNLEKIIPSYHYIITISCLRALRKLQKMGHIPEDLNIFKQYACVPSIFDGVRMCAFEILVEHLSLRADEDLLEFLFDAIETDHSYAVKQHIIAHLCRSAPFKFNADEFSKAEVLVNKLWNLMTKFGMNFRLKSGLAKLYQSLYGFSKPKCLRQVMKPFNDAVEAVNLF